MFKSSHRQSTSPFWRSGQQQHLDSTFFQQSPRGGRKGSASDDDALQTYLKTLNLKSKSVKQKARFEDDQSSDTDLSLSEDSDLIMTHTGASFLKSPFLKPQSKPPAAGNIDSSMPTFINSLSKGNRQGSQNVSAALNNFIKFDKKYSEKLTSKREISEESDSDLENIIGNKEAAWKKSERLKMSSDEEKSDNLWEMIKPNIRNVDEILDDEKGKNYDEALQKENPLNVPAKDIENKKENKRSTSGISEVQSENTRESLEGDRVSNEYADMERTKVTSPARTTPGETKPSNKVKVSSMFSIHGLHTVEELLGSSDSDGEGKGEESAARIQKCTTKESDETLTDGDKKLYANKSQEDPVITLEPSRVLNEAPKTMKDIFSNYHSSQFHSSLFTGAKVTEKREEYERQTMKEGHKETESSRHRKGKQKNRKITNPKRSRDVPLKIKEGMIKEDSSNSPFKTYNLHTVEELQSGNEILEALNSFGLNHSRTVPIVEGQSITSDTGTFVEETVAESSETVSSQRKNSLLDREGKKAPSQAVSSYIGSSLWSGSYDSSTSKQVSKPAEVKQHQRTVDRKRMTKDRGRRKETRNVGVQVEPQALLSYAWNPNEDLKLTFPPRIDPAPIAKYTISPESVEAMTTYSPCMFALNELLRQQMQLTRHFLDTQKHMYQAYCSAVQVAYHPVTVQGTKEYIQSQRKPPLSFKEALKMVKREMKES